MQRIRYWIGTPLMEDEVMPHVDFMAKLELDSIYEFLQSPWQTNRDTGLFMLGEFLAHVHVLRTRGLESFTPDETQQPMENT
jgi:hypothetical protein